MKPTWNNLKRYLLEVFSCASRAINVVLFFGTADITLSARAYRDELWVRPWIDGFFRIVFRESEHCRVWWEAELRRSRENIADHEALLREKSIADKLSQR